MTLTERGEYVFDGLTERGRAVFGGLTAEGRYVFGVTPIGPVRAYGQVSYGVTTGGAVLFTIVSPIQSSIAMLAESTSGYALAGHASGNTIAQVQTVADIVPNAGASGQVAASVDAAGATTPIVGATGDQSATVATAGSAANTTDTTGTEHANDSADGSES